MQSEVKVGESLTSGVQAGVEGNRIADVLSATSAVHVRTHVVDASAATTDATDSAQQLAEDLRKFQTLATSIRSGLAPAADFDARCDQLFSLANDLFGHAPTWVCFFREVLSCDGIVHVIFPTKEEYERFLVTSHYNQIEQMLTALRSRDLPENDPNDPQRMITVRLPKSLHETLCYEAGRLNISVNKLCISRLLQLLDRSMIPETGTKPRGRKPRTHAKQEAAAAQQASVQ